MGLVTRTLVESATCDACGAEILVDAQARRPHHGVLRSEFGYGSPLDHLGNRECVLCEACWRKACAALGLDPSILQRTTASVVCGACGQPIESEQVHVQHPDGRRWHTACHRRLFGLSQD